MKIYIAGPLFNDLELKQNSFLNNFLLDLGFDTYLPQKDGGTSFDIITRGENANETRNKIFKRDIEEIINSDIVLCILDGRVPDEGMCVELGIGFALKKPCIGYTTDKRSLDQYGQNLMLEGCLSTTVHSPEELRAVLVAYK